jgi:predicted amidophosphoribosyltransferase
MPVVPVPYGALVPTRLLSAVHELASVVLPSRCPGCDRIGDPVCGTCLRALRRPPPMPPPPGIDAWVAAFAYEGIARELVARAKYRGRHASLPWLARAMVRAWAATLGPVSERPTGCLPDVVTWVPTVPARRRARGFDHARALASGVAHGLGCRAQPLLTRTAGPAQTGLPLAARRAGPVVRARRAVSGVVLLVDDVATTGASLRVCSAVLRDAGAASVFALTAARTPAPAQGSEAATRRAST